MEEKSSNINHLMGTCTKQNENDWWGLGVCFFFSPQGPLWVWSVGDVGWAMENIDGELAQDINTVDLEPWRPIQMSRINDDVVQRIASFIVLIAIVGTNYIGIRDG